MRTAILITYLTLLSFQLSAQEYAVDLIPSALKSRASATIRYAEMNVEMKADDNVIIRATKATTVYNKAGNEYARTVLFYDKSTDIKSIKGKVYNAAGIPVSEFTQKNFTDESAGDNVSMFNDGRVKHYLPNIQDYPFTVVISYEYRNKQNLSIPVWNPNSNDEISVEKSIFRFSYPTQEKIRIKSQEYNGKVKEEETNGIQTLTWEVNDIAANKREVYSRPRHLTSTLIRVVPERFSYYNKKGSFTNWQEFGDWVAKDLLAGKQQLSEKTIQQVREMTSTAKTDREKAKILYEYMQNKTRYVSVQVGIGGLQPYSALAVDQTGYGDCKALVNYMQSLLSVVNIPSYYCIVEAGDTKMDVDSDFANVSDGNHIILALPLANDTTWLECTNQKIPFGYLGSFTDDRAVLAVTPEGGRIMRTPKYDEQDNIQKRKAILKVEGDGSISGTVSTSFRGSQYFNHFEATLLSGNEQLKELSEYYDIDNISFQKVKYQELKSDTAALQEDLTIFIKNYVVLNANQMIIHPNLFNIKGNIPDIRNRVNELYINRSYTDLDEISYHLPKEYAGLVKPESKKIACDMGIYELESYVREGTLFFNRKLQIKEGVYPPEKYAEFSNFIREVHQLDKGRFALTKQASADGTE